MRSDCLTELGLLGEATTCIVTGGFAGAWLRESWVLGGGLRCAEGVLGWKVLGG